MPCAPRRDVTAHGAGTDDVNATALPIAARHSFELLAQEKYADEVLRRRSDQKAGKRGHFSVLHRRRITPILLHKSISAWRAG